MFILLLTDVVILRLYSASEIGEEFNLPIANSQIVFSKPCHSPKKTEYDCLPISSSDCYILTKNKFKKIVGC